MKAQYLVESNHAFDDRHGPSEWGRVGFSVNGKVFWVGSYHFPGTKTDTYNDMVRESTDIVAAINSSPLAAA